MVAPTSLRTTVAGGTTGALSEINTAWAAVNELTAFGLRVLIYSGSAYPARPPGVPAGLVRYVGPSQPSDWLSGDEWVNNS
jgi:hypothetical protein